MMPNDMRPEEKLPGIYLGNNEEAATLRKMIYRELYRRQWSLAYFVRTCIRLWFEHNPPPPEDSEPHEGHVTPTKDSQ